MFNGNHRLHTTCTFCISLLYIRLSAYFFSSYIASIPILMILDWESTVPRDLILTLQKSRSLTKHSSPSQSPRRVRRENYKNAQGSRWWFRSLQWKTRWWIRSIMDRSLWRHFKNTHPIHPSFARYAREGEKKRIEENKLTIVSATEVETIHIPQSEARNLYDSTVPIWNMTGEYMIGVEVFHQLHCLVSPLDKISESSPHIISNGWFRTQSYHDD